jgi:hypothetical protein
MATKRKSAAKKKPVKKKTASKKKGAPKRWSNRVTQTSDALDLENGVFKHKDPDDIAKSLKRSAERSKRKKGTPYQSAMSMLTFYINRGGKNLPASRKKVLERAKVKLKELFDKR